MARLSGCRSTSCKGRGYELMVMRRAFCVVHLGIVGIALLAVGSSPCLASTFDSAKKEIEGVLKQVTIAVQRRDIKTFGSFMGPGYTATNTDGKVMKRDEVLNSWSVIMGSLHDVTWKRTIIQISKTGKTVRTVTAGHLVGKMSGQDKKVHKM